MPEPKKLLGHWPTCPLCKEPKPEIKSDANGNPYLWCPNPNCNVQIFTHGKGDKPKHMLAQMIALEAEPAPGAPPEPEAAPPAPPGDEKRDKPARRRGVFTTLLG